MGFRTLYQQPGRQVAVDFHQLNPSNTVINPVGFKKETGTFLWFFPGFVCFFCLVSLLFAWLTPCSLFRCFKSRRFPDRFSGVSSVSDIRRYCKAVDDRMSEWFKTCGQVVATQTFFIFTPKPWGNDSI